MSPEEKMAVRVLALARLTPPFDLLALTKNYATVEFIPFLVDADGVTIGLGGATKPSILINSLKPDTRQNFTLAHELGHVIIPWHTGIIASHVVEERSSNAEYRQMEGEANRFASELLVPATWIEKEFKAGKGFGIVFKKFLNQSGVSRDALLIKLFNVVKFPISCFQVSDSGKILKRYRCGGASSYDDVESIAEMQTHFSKLPFIREDFSAGDRSFVVWIFKPQATAITDDRTWREVLDQILLETGTEKMRPNINAIFPMHVDRTKNTSFEEICSRVMVAYQDRSNIAEAVEHPLFSQYIIKRVKELMARPRK